ncbi:TetR/AcrR family transcriptional regulator [Saccharothrix violaceirubra]|uniref:AcrR family transcriptional regulator n=1 Tax=Saccharothrix violaceirubra TaxID=413306 RepID=A0A7W7T6C2_9PSEU|nr:TetR/AcrR family transcriptional regulator [Saccharothrix violaceirubra]MBB4967389.1 AcrR family transcriptional regulator [Saccharothrix violaceirubra]
MVRLTRAQQQERTRDAVLAAARDEFAEHGYLEARIDRIADRADLTRGAVYSNFPGKRALYLAVLVDLVDHAEGGPVPSPGTPGAFARAWLDRLPLAGDAPADGHLRLRSLGGVLDDEPLRAALAQVVQVEALLLGLALETGSRRVRLAELVLTLLGGVARLAEAAPGAGDPFDVARACDHLASLDLEDSWDPPYLPLIPPPTPGDDPWRPPAWWPDLVGGGSADLTLDGVVAFLGTRRLGAIEEAVRAAGPEDAVTAVVLTSNPAEAGRLVRLRIGDVAGCLHRAFEAPPALRIVLDDDTLAAYAGVANADDTEAAIRVRNGKVVAHASGRGACHAVAKGLDR